MTEIVNENLTPAPEFDPAVALQRLRRKEGNWVEWGQSCQKLQKAGYKPQEIFEATGFEPIQQNQIIVAAQVYASMLEVGVQPATINHYSTIGSDSLYELRILSKQDRAAVADFLYERNINSDGAKEVAKAVKDYADLRQLPTGFTTHPGDAVAYQYWRYATQQNDLMEKTRLVARGLMFAHSTSARQQVEKLLGTINLPQRPSPKLPLYRLESDEELPRFIPVAGSLPLATIVVTEIPPAQTSGNFSVTQTVWPNWVGLPGWQAVLGAIDPVAVFASNQQLIPDAAENEELLLLIDRAITEWDEFKYVAIDRAGQVVVEWFDAAPSEPILGQVILVLRPKRMLAPGNPQERWETEE